MEPLLGLLQVPFASPVNVDDLATVARAAAVHRAPDTECGRTWWFRQCDPQAQGAVLAWAAARQVDFAWIPAARSITDFKLVAFDMDSTLITIECIDEIADYAGVKAEVAAITEAAMQGRIGDYADSLRQRVRLLAGLSVKVLEDVYRERLQLTPGADRLLRALHAAGIQTLLVSGGFTYFADRLRTRLGLCETLANVLEVQDGRLTGRLIGEIVDARAKAARLLNLAERMGVEPGRGAVAIGDGANDLPMMAAAAVSIAHRAKPAVRRAATHGIDHVGLDGAWPMLCGMTSD
jgi:phosphoserine phosphatase